MNRKLRRTFLLCLLFLITCMMLTGCFSVRNTNHFTYEKLSPEAYMRMLADSSNYYLIDVRTAGEYQREHIRNAINISYLNFHTAREVDTLQRDKLVFVYCQTCHRSPLTAKVLKRKGFRKVYDLHGGYQNWKPVARSGNK